MSRVLRLRAARFDIVRAQRTHPEYKKPELTGHVAEPSVRPAITRRSGRRSRAIRPHTCIDIFTTVGVVGGPGERRPWASRLPMSCTNDGVQRRVLTQHSEAERPDEPMHAQRLADLRPFPLVEPTYVSNDNALRGSFQNLQHIPRFPITIRAFCRSFAAGTMPTSNPWLQLVLRNPRRSTSGDADQVIAMQEAPRSLGRSSRPASRRCAEAQTAPGGRLHVILPSNPSPHRSIAL